MNARNLVRAAIAAGFIILLAPTEAFGWGAATHAKLATDVLAYASALPAAIAALLGRHAPSFVFGNIAADVVFAKRMSRVKQFCHHWSTGFRFLERADSEADQAFAYGYLAHLAADTIAHNKYVPHQLSVTGTTINFGHLYWEMRADALVDRASWWIFEDVMAADHEHHHRALEAELTATLLPYGFNRRLFDRMNRLVIRQYWHKCMQTWYRHSRWQLSEILLDQYLRESVERIRSVLAEGEQSAVLREDPNGRAALHQARLHRRTNRRLRRRGISTSRRSSEAAAALEPLIGEDE